MRPEQAPGTDVTPELVGEAVTEPAVARAGGRRRGSVAGLALAIVVAAPLGLITGPLVARALGPDGRGEVATATVFGTVTWMVLGLGMPWAVAHRRTTEPGRDAALVGASVRYALCVLPVSLVLAAAVVRGPLDHLSRSALIGTFVLIAVAPLNIVTNCQQAMLVAEGALGAMSALRTLPIALSAAATIVLAVTGALTVTTYLATTVVSGLLVNVVTWRYLPVRPKGTVPLGPLLSYGTRSVGGQLASFGNRAFDQLALATFVGSRQLGVYAVAVTVALAPLGLSQAIAARAFGEVAGATEGARIERAERYMRQSLLVGVVGAAAIAVVAPWGVPLLFGRAFDGAVMPLLLLLPGAAGLGLGMTGARTLSAIGRPGSATIAELAGLVVTLGGLAAAIPLAGISGAAVVSTLAYWTRNAVQLVVLRRHGIGSVVPTRQDAADVVSAAVRPLRRLRSQRSRSARTRS